jgi:hypothetical protein
MCRLCDAGQPQDHTAADDTAAHRWDSRRGFLKAAAGGTAGAAGAVSILAPRQAQAAGEGPPEHAGRPGRRC